MAFFSQLGLLLKKNFLLQRRKICVTVFEIILPLLFAVVFLGIRFAIEIRHEPARTYSNNEVTRRLYEYYLDRDTILYTPNNTVIRDIISDVETVGNRETKTLYGTENDAEAVVFMGFQSRRDMLQYHSFNSQKIFFGIEFENVKQEQTSLPKKLRLALRPPVERYRNWFTTQTAPFVQAGIPSFSQGPGYESFLRLQLLLHEAVIKHWNQSSNSTLTNMRVELNQMPEPPYIVDPMILMLQTALPVLLMLSFILMAIQTTKGIVYEKERKLKESMKLMGLSAAAHWTSWFIYSFIYVIVIMALYAVFCGVDASGNGAPLSRSDPSLFFVFLLCYGVAIISFCFMISVFTQRANIGAAICGIVFFVSYCPYFYLQSQYQYMTRSAKLASCLLINLGMSFGAYTIALNEGTGSGAKWSNVDQPASLDDNFSLLDAMLMLLLDTAIHLVITWYVDNVRPGEFGVPKPLYFPFTRAYWCGSKQKMGENSTLEHHDSTHFEKEPGGLKVGISVRNLVKVFGSGGGKKIAVNGMNLNMYEGQISVLLGHNGAGKTTTMSVLTGFIPASGGSALVNGYDINTDIQSVRQSLGLCPQHNILFDTLTVQEHLEFFASLKGCPSKTRRAEVDMIIKEVGLQLKRFTQSQHLSGGQKRKLSVGIALIAGSKVVILDEPTSGMDPAARRQTWDILQRNRHGRTMLLTTHFMDEADLLGDRIAIMAEGVVKCSGTSYFLKKLYGAGYHLVMVKQPACEVTAVTAVVQHHIPTAVIESEINAELSYLLPDDHSSKFADLFTEIEKRSAELGISSFGTSATTMEEVFLKVEKEDEAFGDARNENGAMSNHLIGNSSYSLNGIGLEEVNENMLAFNQGFKKTTGLFLELSRFRGMFMKKVLHTWRNRTITIVQLLLPIIFAIVALAISKIEPGKVVEVPLTLDLTPFKGSYVPYRKDSPPHPFSESIEKAYVAQFSGTNDKTEEIPKPNTTEYFLKRAEALGSGVYHKKVVIGAEFESNTTLKGFYNGLPYHSKPISLSYLMNAVLKHFASEDHSVTTINNPLPFNASESSSAAMATGLGIGFAVAFSLLFGMAFLSSSFVYFLIKERLVGAKHLQVVSGVGPFVFWMSNFAWDFINYMIPVFILLAVFGGFQSPAYTEDGRLGIVFLVLVVYGLAFLPFMYILQYMFRSPATGLVVIIILNIITGLATLLTTMILDLVRLKDESKVLDWIFTILFPHYNFGESFLNMYTNYGNLGRCVQQNYTIMCSQNLPHPCCKDTCGEWCVSFVEDYLSWETPGVGRSVIFMLIQCIVFMLLTLFIEYRLPQRIMYMLKPRDEQTQVPYIQQPVSENLDVATERQRIAALQIGHENSDALVLKDLYKRYGNFVAVDHLTVGIPEKECFGLLGQNGAGKTTTFKMLTGDVMVTSGNASLWSYDVKNSIQKVQENMGYCPQFDALIDQMTGRETLTMYARLKGVPERAIKDVCKSLLNIMMLRQYADKPTSDYSGGNKRKLSTAIALVGDPAFIMLDEPSTGMDPKARRQLWNVLSKVRECGRTLLLTSHSMEECDALCTRIAIMVNGRFMCLGTPQHLKNTFGQGYTLIARMATIQNPPGMAEEKGPAPSEPLIQFIISHYPNSQVFDDHQGYVHFQVPYTSVSLAQVFTLMEQAKVHFSVEDYSVHQTTLEQIFLTFARAQVPPREDKTGLCKRICCCC